MLSNVLRDAELVDAVKPALAPLADFQAEVVEILSTGWAARGRRRHVLTVVLRHAIDFPTWRSLTGHDGLTRAEAVALLTTLVECAALGRRAPA